MYVRLLLVRLQPQVGCELEDAPEPLEVGDVLSHDLYINLHTEIDNI